MGGSFTFGEDVSDLEAWSAQLQRLTGRRVLNGGVSGYGFDTPCCAPSSSRQCTSRSRAVNAKECLRSS
jgi:hypothetical protein